MRKKRLKLLYKSFDANLTDKEQQQLDQTLASSKSLQDEKEQIEKIRKSISNSVVNSFSPLFTERVMQKITDPIDIKNNILEEFSNSLLWSFRRIAVAGGVIILLLLVNNFVSSGTVSLDAALSFKQMSVEEVWSLNDIIAETVK